VEETPPPEFDLEQLRVDVVMIEDEPLAEKVFPESGDDEQQVGRIARLHHVESDFEIDLHRQHEFPEQRRGVFQRVSCRPVGFERQRVAEHVDTFHHFVGLRVLRPLRADHRHHVAGVAQCARLLPHSPVERHGQILDDDQNARSFGRHGNSLRRLRRTAILSASEADLRMPA